MSLEESPLLEHVRTSTSGPIRDHLGRQRYSPVAIKFNSPYSTEDDTTVTEESYTTGLWEEYCEDGLQEGVKRKNPVKEFWKRVEEDFPGVVTDLLGDIGKSVTKCGFVWGNLGGMFCNTFYRAALARRKEYRDF